MTATAPFPAAPGPRAPGVPAGTATPAYSRWLGIAVLIGAVVGMADATLVAIALDPLSRHFGQSLDASQQVVTLYLVTVTATLPLLGRLGDRVGRREVYLGGFAVFAAGSLLAALAPTYGILLLGRAVQALGGGMLTSGSLALVAHFAPRRTAARSIALLVIAQAIAGLVAPPVGGVLVAVWDWQAVFWVGVPVAVGGFALTLLAVPRTAQPVRPGGIDPLGALGLGALLLGLGSGISALGGDAVGGLPAWGWLLVAAAGAVLLLAVEPRTAHPLIDRRLLGGRFGRATLATLLSTGSLMTCFALLPYWLESAHGASAALAGLAFLPIGVGIALTSRLGGRLGDRGRTRMATVAGMLVAAGGLGMAAVAGRFDQWWLLAIGFGILGAGNGLFSSPNTAAAMGVASRSGLSSAAGLLSTARNAGVVVGLGTVGAAYTATTRGMGPGRADSVAALVFVAAAAVCLLVAVLTASTYRPVAAAGASPPPA